MIHAMKNTLKYIAFGIALLASCFALKAQPGSYHAEGGMKTSKTVTGPKDGFYTISLESFATGESTVTETGTPVDIVLVLDVSGSMDKNLAGYVYTARNSQDYSYRSYGNNTYYYKHTDGEYYAVQRYGEATGYGWNSDHENCYLYFYVNNTIWFLSGTGEATTTEPAGVNGNNTTIWSGVLYGRSRQTKMEALKEAVGLFIDSVTKNATEDSHGNARRVDSRISIVKFAGRGDNNPAYYDGADQDEPSGTGNNKGNHRDGGGNNYTEIVSGLTSVLDGGATTLKNKVNSLQAGGATAANGGMQLAVNLISNIPDSRESNKVVVMFTDGEPTYESDFNTTVAGQAIGHAYTLKHLHDATVYTIGVFDNETTQIKNYMNWTSSNYPNQEGWVNNGSTTTPATGSYYQKSDGANLNDIFNDIASSAAVADATAGATTQVRDVISNSFIMPEGNAAKITIQVADIASDGEDWEDPVDAEGVSYKIKTVTTSTGEQHKELMVTGFDYTKPDEMSGGFTTKAGNWVGERYSDATTSYWAGKKLIIQFKIKANEEATGGDGTATNHPDSGVYVLQYEDDGVTPKLDEHGDSLFVRVNQYDVPSTPLPLLIKIKKDGLRKGESATFQLLRIKPKMKVVLDEDGNVIKSKVDPAKDSLVFDVNAIGKPKPNTHEFVDHIVRPDGSIKELDEDDPVDQLLGCGWEDWSKVILTNKTGDTAYVEKDLYGLDPGWVYMVIEDDWGWAYELTGTASNQTTSDYEINPFIFHNTPRTVNFNGDPIVKHAEAVTINHFDDKEGNGHYEEHYKSSKTRFETR